jgi:hypothetical protein
MKKELTNEIDSNLIKASRGTGSLLFDRGVSRLAFVITLLASPLSTPVLRGPGRSELRMACFQWRLRKRKIDGDWEMIR